MSLALPRTEPPQTVDGVLAEVQRCHRRQVWWAALRLALWVTAGTGLLTGGLRFLNLLIMPPATAALIGLVLGSVAALIGTLGRPPFTPLDAARLTDHRAHLSALLTTALTLPDKAAWEWEAALHERVRTQAQEAARSVDGRAVVSAPATRVWIWPALFLLLSAIPWAVSPLPRSMQASAPPPAAVVEDTTPAPPTPEGSAPATTPPNTDAPIVNEPTLDAQGNAASGPTPTPSNAQRSDPQGTSASGVNANQAGTSGGTNGGTPKDSSQPLNAAATAAQAANGQGGRTTNTPFGSRETGVIQEYARQTQNQLAAAPYDPNVAKGAKLNQQKADPNKPGTRTASGGRAIESNGRDRCADPCLTNNSMSRGASRTGNKPRDPQGNTSSGTSDSGGSAAGSTSSVGLGSGALRDVQNRYHDELVNPDSVNADRVQVLIAPTTASTHTFQSTSGTTWVGGLETPTSTPSIPQAARDTVRTFFQRNTP